MSIRSSARSTSSMLFRPSDLLSKTFPLFNTYQSILKRLHSISHKYAESLLHKVLKEGYFWPNVCNDCHNTACHYKEASTSHGSASTLSISHEFVKVICELCFPKIVQANNGTEFVNKVMSVVSARQALITANGATESHVKLTKSMLLKSLKGGLRHWSNFLPIAQFALNQPKSLCLDFKLFKLFFGRLLSYLDIYFNSISKLKTLHEITSLTKVMLQIVYPFIYEKKGISMLTTGDKVKNLAYIFQDIISNTIPDTVPPSALKPIDPNTPFEDKHFKVEKVLDYNGLSFNYFYCMKWKEYLI
ncbi:hypothetical protein QOT17_022768 [Balamuthia mandrillaris]